MENKKIEKNKFVRTMRVLGRLILDLRREQANATFEVPTYPDNETLYKLGLAAIGEINKPEIISILKEASRRDSGVKHVVNDILNNLLTQQKE